MTSFELWRLEQQIPQVHNTIPCIVKHSLNKGILRVNGLRLVEKDDDFSIWEYYFACSIIEDHMRYNTIEKLSMCELKMKQKLGGFI